MTIQLLLPAAGRANRMGGLLKELLPLGVRMPSHGHQEVPAPVIAWSLQTGLHAGADGCIVVTSFAKAPVLREVIASLDVPIPVIYHCQQVPNGLCGAAACAQSYVADDDIILMLMPDTVMYPTVAVSDAVRAVQGGALVCTTLYRVDQPERFGVATFSESGDIIGFTDKPIEPASSWIWTAVAFQTRFFSAIGKSVELAEESLTAPLDWVAKQGQLDVRYCSTGSYWDVGTYEDYLSALRVFQNRNIDPAKTKGSLVRVQ